MKWCHPPSLFCVLICLLVYSTFHLSQHCVIFFFTTLHDSFFWTMSVLNYHNHQSEMSVISSLQPNTCFLHEDYPDSRKVLCRAPQMTVISDHHYSHIPFLHWCIEKSLVCMQKSNVYLMYSSCCHTNRSRLLRLITYRWRRETQHPSKHEEIMKGREGFPITDLPRI